MIQLLAATVLSFVVYATKSPPYLGGGHDQGGHTLGGNKFKDFSKPFQGLSSDCSMTIPMAFYQVMSGYYIESK